MDGSMLAAMVGGGNPFSVYVSELDHPDLREYVLPGMSCGWAMHFALSFDGDDLAFWCEEAVGDSEREGIWLAHTDGSGAPVLLVPGGVKPIGFTADGRWLLFSRNEVFTDGNTRPVPYLQAVRPPDDGPHEPVPLEPDPGMTHGQFSPDGRWLAYSNDNESSETTDVYLRRFRDDLSLGPRIRVTDGGVLSWSWAKQPPEDGMEIFFLAPDLRGMSITVEGDQPSLSESVEIMARVPVEKIQHADVLPDRRFLSMTDEGEAKKKWQHWQETEGRRFHVVLNWTQGLRNRVPRNLE